MVSAIDAKYNQLTGTSSWIGQPTIAEQVCSDGIGHYRHYQNASIYWTPNTGAHIVKDYIRGAWAEQGWERGKLGYPVTDELVIEGTNGRSRYNRFEGGEICWTPEGGTRTTLTPVNIELWFSGFKCPDESSELSGSDEPYLFLGVSTSGQPQTPHETALIEGVNKGEVTGFAKRLYAGMARDLILAVVIRENDEGVPHAFSSAFKSILDGGNAALARQLGGVSVPHEVLKLVSNQLGKLVGVGDDDVGRRAELLTQNYLIQMARKEERGDPASDFTWDLGSNGEGRYRLYFFVRRV